LGLKIAAEGGVGAALFLILPGTLIASYGFTGLVAGMLIAMALLSPLLLLLPARGTKSHEQELEEYNSLDELPESINHWAIWSALLALLVFFAGASAVWAFMERLGNNAGYDAQSIAGLLAVSLAFATLGSLVSAVLGKYFGNARPFLFCLLAILTAMFILGGAESFTSYAVGCCLFTAAFGAGLPFAVAEIAELDVDGRYAVLSVPAIGLGAMIGPGAAGLAYTGDSAATVLSLVGATMIMAAAMVGFAQWRRAA
jgi:LPXTG-motif cell wall-anchored protein